MKDKSTDEALKIVTPQEYSLALMDPLFPGSIDPFKVWDPPSNKRLFDVEELYKMFSKECIAFVGDSTDRRAADTLHILLTNRHNLSSIDNKHYVYKWNRKSEDNRRQIYDDKKEKPGCDGSINNMFRPTYANMLNFSYQDHPNNYTVIIASTGPWNNLGQTPQKARENIQKVIHHFHHEIPNDVLLLWKTASWSRYANWNYLQDNETNVAKHGSNYLVHYANEVTRKTIQSINSTRLRLVDWSREICPYVWERKKATNMRSEDGNPWHLGAKARVLLIQMIAWEYTQFQKEKQLAVQGEVGSSHSVIDQQEVSLEQRCEGCRQNGTAEAHDDHLSKRLTPQDSSDVATRAQYLGGPKTVLYQQTAIWIGVGLLVVLRHLMVKRKKMNMAGGRNHPDGGG